MIDSFYEGKNVFLTGCTGFVGKVLLEKILFSLPRINKVYVLIRTKKGSSTEERFKKEIFDSLCFDRLRAREPNFDEFMKEKLVPIAGDMLKDGLDLSPEDYQELTQNVHIIINSAASVDFNQRLDMALQINTFGSLRVLALGKACRNLISYVQVSTAYVNCDKRGWVDEKFYPLHTNPRTLLAELVAIPLEEIERRTPGIIGNYPNTYTFTKNLAEQLIMLERENLPICVVRPSIIGASWKEPVPGWIDSVSAAATFYLAGGLGLLRVTVGKKNYVGDQIPVDVVINSIIAASVFLCKPGQIYAMHAGSSARNPITWISVTNIVQAYWRKNPSEKAFGICNFKFVENPKVYEMVRFFQRKLPIWAFTKYAQFTKSPGLLKQAGRFNKFLSREKLISDSFSYFTCNEWVFSTQQSVDMMKIMTEEEKQVFDLDIAKMDWRVYLSNFTYGLQRFILKEYVDTPVSEHSRDLVLNYRGSKYFSDVNWALSHGEIFKITGFKEMKGLILNSPRVQNIIKELNSKDIKDKIDHSYRAKSIVNKMLCDMRMPMVRFFGWALRKIWRRLYEKIVVDQTSLNVLKQYRSETDGPLVLIPSHRSYLDFLIVSYVLFSYDIRVPYIAAAEEFKSIRIINHLLKVTGAFFIKRKLQGDPLYAAILTEYMHNLLKEQQIVEFFIEGTRSRTGKTLHPKFGLLSICTEAFFEKKVPNVNFVPVTINYERVLEGETFPFELLGEEKVKESLSRIMKSSRIINTNLGKIFVEIGKPISLKDYCKTVDLDPYNIKDHRDIINRNLGYEMVYQIQDLIMVMPTSIVASIMLMHRRKVLEDELIAKSEWIRDEIKARGYKVGMNDGSGQGAVRNAVHHLSQALTHKKDLFEPSVMMKTDYKNILLMSYYRNALYHIFSMESICACALFSFGQKLAWEEGINQTRVMEEIRFLSSILASEFISRENSTKEISFLATLENMKKRGFIEEIGDKFRIKKTGELGITFLCSLLWPIIDSYWITLMFTLALYTRKNLTPEKVIQSIQWFAENMYEERMLGFYEACSLENMKNAVKSYEMMGVIQKTEKNGVTVVELTEKYADEASVQELVDHVGNFRKATLTGIVTPKEELRRLLISEFPEMPKL